MNGGNVWPRPCWDGFRVLDVSETPEELIIKVETMATVVGCAECGTRAESHDRDEVDIRDLAVSAVRCGLPTNTGVLGGGHGRGQVHGEPPVDDSDRVGVVTELGVD